VFIVLVEPTVVAMDGTDVVAVLVAVRLSSASSSSFANLQPRSFFAPTPLPNQSGRTAGQTTGNRTNGKEKNKVTQERHGIFP
jgi:hypothetical protein